MKWVFPRFLQRSRSRDASSESSSNRSRSSGCSLDQERQALYGVMMAGSQNVPRVEQDLCGTAPQSDTGSVEEGQADRCPGEAGQAVGGRSDSRGPGGRPGKRDSGYLTDNSPATYGAHPHFTFDLNRGSESDVFDDVSPHFFFEGDEDDGDDQRCDEEVAETAAMSREVLKKPREKTADDVQVNLGEEEEEEEDEDEDLEGLVDVEGDDDEDDETGDDCAFAESPGRAAAIVPVLRPRALTLAGGWPRRSWHEPPRGFPLHPPGSPLLLSGGYRFHALLRCHAATQTPHLHCQMIHQVMSEPECCRAHIRGTVHTRLRFFSDGDEGEEGGREAALPDIVPLSRDRSASLPNVQALRQQREREVGRELRRISDEFHFSYRGRLPSVQEEFNGEASSFPGARRSHSFRELWGVLREMFAPTPSLHNLVDIENPPAPR